jgi:hypothetical protein
LKVKVYKLGGIVANGKQQLEWVQLSANSKHCWEGISRVLQMVGNVIKVFTCAIKVG